MKRLVVDASTLVSGVASRQGGGAPWLLLAALLDFEFEVVTCPKLISEFRDALGNKYFQERFDPDDLAEIVARVEEAGVKLDHAGLEPPAIDARAACRLLGLMD